MLNRLISRAFATTLFVGAIGVFAQQPSYTEEREFAAVRLTYRDLSLLLGKLQQLVTTANRNLSGSYGDDELTLAADGSRFFIEKHYPHGAFENAPPVSYSMSYRYSAGINYPSADGPPISSVSIDVQDYRRKLTVSGRSREQVQALTTVLLSELERFEVIAGGFGFRTFAGIVLLVVALASIFLSQRTSGRAGLTLSIFGLICSLSVWVFPWSRWFPGAAIYAGDASPLVRYAPQISFAGAVITIVTFVIGIVYTKRLSERTK